MNDDENKPVEESKKNPKPERKNDDDDDQEEFLGDSQKSSAKTDGMGESNSKSLDEKYMELRETARIMLYLTGERDKNRSVLFRGDTSERLIRLLNDAGSRNCFILWNIRAVERPSSIPPKYTFFVEDSRGRVRFVEYIRYSVKQFRPSFFLDVLFTIAAANFSPPLPVRK